MREEKADHRHKDLMNAIQRFFLVWFWVLFVFVVAVLVFFSFSVLIRKKKKNLTPKQNKKNPAITMGMNHTELGNLQGSKFRNSDFCLYLTICLFHLPLKFKGVIQRQIESQEAFQQQQSITVGQVRSQASAQDDAVLRDSLKPNSHKS